MHEAISYHSISIVSANGVKHVQWNLYNLSRHSRECCSAHLIQSFFLLHTGFDRNCHMRQTSYDNFRFTEIGQIFHNKYIFNNKNHFPSWNLGNMLWLSDSKTQERGLKELNTKTFLGDPAPQTPLHSAWAFGPRLGNQLVFIPDPRL